MIKSKTTDLYNIYTIYDSVSKRFRGLFYHTSDEDMIRTSLPTVLMDFALRDIKIFKIGTFSEITGVIQEKRHVQIKTDCYTFPHSRLSSKDDDLSLEEIDSAMKEKKSEMISSLSENKTNSKEVVNE